MKDSAPKRRSWNAPSEIYGDRVPREMRHEDSRRRLDDGHFERVDSTTTRHAKYLDKLRQRDRAYDPDLNWWH